MAATKNLSQVLTQYPDFNPGWRLIVNGVVQPPNTDWKVSHAKYGEFGTAVVCDALGHPRFDRPYFAEAPGVVSVVWGVADDGEVRLAVVRQERPHADHPARTGDGHRPILFAQPPMGFTDSADEAVSAGAVREATEEAGTRIILEQIMLSAGQNADPTFIKSSSVIYAIKVDLRQIGKPHPSDDEPIHSAEFVTIPELLRRVREGTDEQGAYYSSGVANAAWLLFLAWLPILHKTERVF